jgi:hypothetical protein
MTNRQCLALGAVMLLFCIAIGFMARYALEAAMVA